MAETSLGATTPTIERTQRRSGRATKIATAVAGATLVAACSSSPEVAVPTATPTQANNALEVKPGMWPNIKADAVRFPGGVPLPVETCNYWGVNRPQPTLLQDGKMFAVVDARRSIPQQCDYEKDSGTGAYEGASYEAPVRQQPEGDGFVPNGTVVEVTAYSIGQRACNQGGASPIWVSYKRTETDGNNWSPIINFGGSPTDNMLVAAGIPEVPSPYADTAASGC